MHKMKVYRDSGIDIHTKQKLEQEFISKLTKDNKNTSLDEYILST